MTDGHTWGHHLDMNITQLYSEIAHADDLHNLQLNPNNSVLNLVLMPKIGFCLDVENYSLNFMEVNAFDGLKKDIAVYLTHRAGRKYFSGDYSSVSGDQIVMKAGIGAVYSYKVRIIFTRAFINYSFFDLLVHLYMIQSADFNYLQ